MKRKIKLCYIGGGSKMWARIFMSDLTLSPHLEGTIALYDIDTKASYINKKIGEYMNEAKNAISKWNYEVHENIDTALEQCDIIVISILPGTLKEMYSDVHTPEAYNIYQSVGDTVGPGGVIRSMRTIPYYEYFARKIEKICPNAWVLNLTNPMSICVKTLYDVFPNIKAIGCCHEVLHTEDLICDIVKENLHLSLNRKDIRFEVSGINHFTWFSEVQYKDMDLLKELDPFFKKHKEGYYEHGDFDLYKTNPFAYQNKVKYDLYKRYGALAAAGDRHLVEFLNNSWYLDSKELIDSWGFALTSVDFRIKQQEERIQESKLMAEGLKEVEVKKSSEEVVDFMEAIFGFKDIISNVNLPNRGQIKELPLNSIVETNAYFSHDAIRAINANPLPKGALDLVSRNLNNIELCYEGCKKRDLDIIFASFINQPLCSKLTLNEGKELFNKMIYNTKDYLHDYKGVDKIRIKE